jgi:hypothetical protein
MSPLEKQIAELSARLAVLEARPDLEEHVANLAHRVTALENALPEDHLATNTKFINGAGEVEG